MAEVTDRKTIGNLNGKWSILFRATLAVGAVLQPLIVAWAIWVTVEVFENKAHRELGSRFTVVDAAKLETTLREDLRKIEKELRAEISALPSPDFRKKIDNIDAKIEMIAANVTELRIIVAKLK